MVLHVTACCSALTSSSTVKASVPVVMDPLDHTVLLYRQARDAVLGAASPPEACREVAAAVGRDAGAAAAAVERDVECMLVLLSKMVELASAA